MLVPAGGLSEDGMEWIEAPRKFFVPVKAVSAMFRGILVRLIKEQWDNNAFKIPDGFPGFVTMKRELYEKREFTRRFMMHILPAGFYKIRYYGILATANIKNKRQQAIALIGKTIFQPILEGLNAYEVYRILRRIDPARCPKCQQGIMVRYSLETAPG